MKIISINMPNIFVEKKCKKKNFCEKNSEKTFFLKSGKIPPP